MIGNGFGAATWVYTEKKRGAAGAAHVRISARKERSGWFRIGKGFIIRKLTGLSARNAKDAGGYAR